MLRTLLFLGTTAQWLIPPPDLSGETDTQGAGNTNISGVSAATFLEETGGRGPPQGGPMPPTRRGPDQDDSEGRADSRRRLGSGRPPSPAPGCQSPGSQTSQAGPNDATVSRVSSPTRRSCGFVAPGSRKKPLVLPVRLRTDRQLWAPFLCRTWTGTNGVHPNA